MRLGELLRTYLRGFAMGSADIVPGVSGGTVALVFGIYRRLIDSIRLGSSALGRLLKLDVAGARVRLGEVEWGFLLPLLAGIGSAVLVLSSLIESLLHDRPVEMAGLFTGLVLGSVVIAWGLLQQRDLRRVAVLVVTAVVVFLLMGVTSGTSEETVSQVSDPALWAFFGAGALAICAMILPGVSGSFLLVTMGMYGAVLAAVNDRDLVAVGLFGLGCVVGLALFSQVLHWALSRHYDTVMAALIGLMLGSLRVLWPWPGGVDSTELGAPDDPIVFPVGLAVVGLAVVLAVDLVGRRLERQSVADEVDELHV
jgi:putative membrane protein